MRTPSILVFCVAAALLASPAPAAAADGATGVEATRGFAIFQQYCLHPSVWKTNPELPSLDEAELASGERPAIATDGRQFRYFLASAEPRVVLALNWKEQRLTPSLVGLDGRCVVFAYENVWEGMPEALARVTGLAPSDTRDISSPERGLDGVMLINRAALRRPQDMKQPTTVGATRFDGTTMYRAIL